MKTLILTLMISLTHLRAFADCSPPDPTAPTIGPHFGQIADNIGELTSQFELLYNSPNRLINRVYQGSDKAHYLAFYDGKLNAIPAQFFAQLKTHIEQALNLGYADQIIYADMGHVHLLIPEGTEFSYHSPKLKFLYHTAELLRLKDGNIFTGPVRTEPWLAWRYHSRNFIAQNFKASHLTVLFERSQSYNTVREIDGYREVRTLYFTSNQNGCFRYQRGSESLAFDVSF